jgi:hypothetical protein
MEGGAPPPAASGTTTKKPKHHAKAKAAPAAGGAEQPAGMPEASAGGSVGAAPGGMEASAEGAAGQAPKAKHHHRASRGGAHRAETDRATQELRAEQLQRVNTAAAPPANAKVKSSSGASTD